VIAARYRIGQLAAIADVAASALRYYDEAGLLQPEERTEAGYRLYGPGAVGRLQFIRRAQGLGLSLREIHQLVASPEADAAAERDRLRHVVAHKLAETTVRLNELEILQSELKGLYVRLHRAPGPECGHLGDCACWLPTEKEVKSMTEEIACCDQLCCPECACTQGAPCDCSDCSCSKTGR